MPKPHPSRRALSQLAVASLLSVLVVASARAQSPPPQPNAGSILQQVQPSLIPAPASEQAQPAASLPRAVSAPTSGGGGKVSVKGFRINGIAASRAEPLLPLVQKYVGADKTLADLEDAAKDVEVALQRQGLFLAQAYIPEQSLGDGIVVIQVLEGHIGAVTVEVEPGVKVSPEFMDRIVAILRGNPVAERDLIEKALFTLGDLRGISVTTALTPGDRIGQADLAIKVSPAAGFAGSGDLDNGGSIFTGRYRANAGFDLFNPTGHGDVLSLRAQATTDLGSEFVRASWLTPVNALGTKFGIAASYLHYKLGSTLFEALGAHGTAEDYALQLLHPLIRSRNDNLFVQGSIDYRRFDDRVDGSLGLISGEPLDTRKDVAPFANLAVVGDFRDTIGGGGISNYSLGVVGGKLRIKDEDDIVVDQNNYRSAGYYAKMQLAGSRLQVLPTRDYLFLAVSGQLAMRRNLDSSEKFSMGGPYGVRGYPSPESPSDTAAIATWEYRKTIPVEALPGDLVASVFGDYGIARLHDHPLGTDTDNVRKFVSHGIGITYGSKGGLTVKGFLAARGGVRAESDDSRARLYVLLSQQF